MRMAITSEIACPPARLWQFLHEPAKQKLWMKGLLENEQTSPGPEAVGSTFRMKIKEGAKAADYTGEITALKEPEHLGVRFWGGNFPEGMAMQVDYRLTDLGGRTRLDYVAEGQCGRMPWWMRLLMPLFSLFGKMQLKSFLKTLKRLAEAPAGP